MGKAKGATTVERDGEEPQANEVQDNLDDQAKSQGDDGRSVAEAESAQQVRRRLVSELLEGQEEILAGALSDLVAERLSAEAVDAGGPIYQLSLDGSEPEGVLLEPERTAWDVAGDLARAGAATPHHEWTDVRQALIHLLHERDLLVMRGERDGIGAYEVATGVGEFVDIILATIRRYGNDGT